MTHAALPRSEAFHLRLEVQARARDERRRGTIGLRVRHLSLSYLSERCVRVDSCYTIIHLHVFVKYEVQFVVSIVYSNDNCGDKGNPIRWIPHDLINVQKLRRVKRCREMMQGFAGGDSNAVHDIVAGNESWIYCYDPETKRQCVTLGVCASLAVKVGRARAGPAGEGAGGGAEGRCGHARHDNKRGTIPNRLSPFWRPLRKFGAYTATVLR
ncbi:hypothetical protein EVAR_97523_1 [Eumeta japonica]|uniref:Uncharacterized protein n=1 Tax=Eumeta variegata TaxID=151549 RepID=A0A4C1WLZ7_EUMVA|nr:hypothetical protein EVAR_97523_1 [Eumeta japonica]